MTPEGKVKDAIMVFLNTLKPDCWWYKPVPTGYGKRGVPDFIGCYKGKFFSIEAKRPGAIGSLTPYQIQQNSAIEEAGGIAILADNAELVKEAFRRYL